ncbi:Dipeptidyl aminopeptidase/acylaminoacyl peptidase [Novosphingobium sp. CF614]|uniref:alpha/beta hydrolase family protein n=1 Tax=Novosphingobium sp. CF614 TaxID=1884364 RepID=UPI0008E8DF71|nr:S9 family peptidase [Novosphingobium sp. CF614]SFG33666.1 Dipeptidyl aminopeptidase/acylaminoacyl peptidase [Novosphingobium sp. CF614]
MKMIPASGLLALAIASGIAHAAPPPLDAYGELPAVEDMAISPGGNLATLAQIAGMRRVVALDAKNDLRINAPVGDAKVRSVDWADDDMLLVTKTDTVSLGPGFTASKYELAGTIVFSITNPKPELVFARSKGIADTTRGRYGIRTIDGATVGYFGGIALDVTLGGTYFRHGRATLYAVDLAHNRAKLAATAPAEDHYSDWLVDAGGKVAARLDVAASNGLWRIRNSGGDEIARGVDPLGDVSLMFFGQDGSTLVYSIDDENGNSRWLEVPLAGGTPQAFLPDVEVETTYVDRGTGRIIGYRERGATPKTVMYDPKLDKFVSRIFAAFSGRNARLVDWTPDFSKVIVRTHGSQDSGTWYMVDMATRRADPIGHERLKIAAPDVGPVSKVDYVAADGLEMDGILTLPPGREAKGLPVILLPHGGPGSHDEVGFDWWAQAFASRGYAVFQPNFRGSTNRDDAFRRAGNGQWGRKMQSDITDGLAELTKRGIVDPKRACIVGASYGGYAALAGVTLQQGRYRCAVSVAGVADVELMYQTDVFESGNSRMTGRALRDELGDPKGYDEISPRRFAKQADAPILLIHGKDDTVVPFKQSQVMADALKDAGKPYEMVVLKGEDHWLSRGETRKQMLEAAVRFVQQHNPAE